MYLKLDNDTTYALSVVTQRLVHIDEVDNGLKCKCICPCCKQSMIANQGEKNQHYFSHERKAGTNIDVTKCRNITMHYVALHIIAENKSVMMPPYFNIEKSKRIEFAEVEIEKRNDRPDLQPDIVGITNDGKRYYIEIKYTHALDDNKIRKIYSDDLTCVEIDISKQRMDNLENFLLNQSDDRVWINNKYGFESIESFYQKQGKDVRVISVHDCRRKGNNTPPVCKNFLNKIRHGGMDYVVCDSIPDCSYSIGSTIIIPRKETNINKNSIPNERPQKKAIQSVPQASIINQHREYKSIEPKGANVEENYKCMPDKSSSLDEYFKNIHMNNVFYEEEGVCFKVLNYFRSGDIIGVVLVRIQDEKYRSGYVIISKTSSFIHSWSKTYYDEHTATLALKGRLASITRM